MCYSYMTLGALDKENLFDVGLLKNCSDQQVWTYSLPLSLTKEFVDFVKFFGKPINPTYPLDEGFSFIKLETEDFVITGNLGMQELKLTIKESFKAQSIKEVFESQLKSYMEALSFLVAI